MWHSGAVKHGVPSLSNSLTPYDTLSRATVKSVNLTSKVLPENKTFSGFISLCITFI
jgi:hypothetical protein